MRDSIGFDLDGVLYNWHEIVYEELVNFHGLSQGYDEFWHDQVQNKTKFNKLFFQNLARIPTFCTALKIKDSDLDLLNKLHKRYNIYYITNRPKEVEISTCNWITREKLPQYENLIFTADKASKISELNIVAFTDDRLNNVENIRRVCKTFLYSHPWNEGYEADNVIRIYGLEELLNYL